MVLKLKDMENEPDEDENTPIAEEIEKEKSFDELADDDDFDDEDLDDEDLDALDDDDIDLEEVEEDFDEDMGGDF